MPISVTANTPFSILRAESIIRLNRTRLNIWSSRVAFLNESRVYHGFNRAFGSNIFDRVGSFAQKRTILAVMFFGRSNFEQAKKGQ